MIGYFTENKSYELYTHRNVFNPIVFTEII